MNSRNIPQLFCPLGNFRAQKKGGVGVKETGKGRKRTSSTVNSASQVLWQNGLRQARDSTQTDTTRILLTSSTNATKVDLRSPEVQFYQLHISKL